MEYKEIDKMGVVHIWCENGFLYAKVQDGTIFEYHVLGGWIRKEE